MKVKKIKKVGNRDVYDISVRDAEHYILENGVVSHNSGLIYSANQAFIIGKAQEKVGTDIVGWRFTLNVEKSRFVREKSKLPFRVFYDGGIQKYSGLLDIAMELNFVVKPSNGWYQRIDPSTGEIIQNKFREKDTNTAEFWDILLNSEEFKTAIQRRYMLGVCDSVDDIEVAHEVDPEDDLAD